VTYKPDFKVMVLLLVFMQLTRDLFAIAKFLFKMFFWYTVLYCIGFSCLVLCDCMLVLCMSSTMFQLLPGGLA